MPCFVCDVQRDVVEHASKTFWKQTFDYISVVSVGQIYQCIFWNMAVQDYFQLIILNVPVVPLNMMHPCELRVTSFYARFQFLVDIRRQKVESLKTKLGTVIYTHALHYALIALAVQKVKCDDENWRLAAAAAVTIVFYIITIR